jgi:O-antigen/teichoic acid export membrane protein
MYKRIMRNSAVLAGGTAASSLFMMLSVAIAARALRPRDFGALALLQSAVLMLTALTSFSTQQPVIKLGSDALVADDRERLGRVVSMGFMIDVIASTIAFLIAVAGILLAGEKMGLRHPDQASAWALAVSLMLNGYPTSNGIFRLYDRFTLLSVLQSASAAGLLIVYAGLFAASAKLQAFVLAWAAYLAFSSGAQVLSSVYLLYRNSVPLRLNLKSLYSADGKTLIQYCWSTWGMSTAQTLRTSGDSLLVGAIVGVEAAGVYNVARQVAGLVRKFNVVYSSTVFPEVARLAAHQDLVGARRLNRHMLVGGLTLTAIAVAVAAFGGREIIRVIFGSNFDAGYFAFVVLTASAMIQLVSITPSMCVQVFRGPKLLLMLHLLATLAFVLAAVAMTVAWSLTGMALAQLIFAIVLAVLCNLALRNATLQV